MNQELHDAICKDLTDRGKLIEAGWISLRFLSIPDTAPQIQIEEMRNAFFCGAQHLFASMMGVLESGEEPTDKDLERITQIRDELLAFIEDYRKRKGISRREN